MKRVDSIQWEIWLNTSKGSFGLENYNLWKLMCKEMMNLDLMLDNYNDK